MEPKSSPPSGVNLKTSRRTCQANPSPCRPGRLARTGFTLPMLTVTFVMGAAVGKPTKDFAGEPELNMELPPAFAVWQDRSHGAEPGIWDADGNFTNRSLLGAADEVLLLMVDEVRPYARCVHDGTIDAVMSGMMKEFQRVRVWNAAQLRVAVDSLSLALSDEPLMVYPSAGDRSSTVSTDGSQSRVSWGGPDAVAAVMDLDGEFLDELDLVCPAGVSVLHEIAQRVILADRTDELLQEFPDARCDVLDSLLSSLERSWWTTKFGMKWWSTVTKLFEKAIVAMRKQLDAWNLGAFHSFRDEYFMAIAQNRILALLTIADESTTAATAPEKLPYILGMYEALSDAAPGLLLLFSSKGGEPHQALVLEGIQDTLTKLADAAYTMMSGLIAKIQHDSSNRRQSAADDDMTWYAMTCVEQLAPHRTVLSLILARGDVDVPAGGAERVTTFGGLIQELIEGFERNLEKKSALICADTGGSPHLFLANNISFVLDRAADADVASVLGDDWIARRRSKLEQHVASYVDATWGPVVACLETSGKPAKALVKFNAAFKESQGCQVPDPALRAALRKAVSGMVVPAYTAFVQRHPDLEKWGSYTVDNLAESLSELFEGEAAHGRNF